MMGRKVLILVFILALGIVMFPAQRVSAAQDQVLLVYNDREKMTVIANLIKACGMIPVPVDSVEYASEMMDSYEYIVMQDAAPFKDALQSGKRFVCLGDDFKVVPGVAIDTVNRKIDAQLRVYNNAQSIFIDQGLTYISEYSGEGVGTISFGGGEYPVGVITDRIMFAPYFGKDDITVFALAKMFNVYFGRQDGGKMYIMIDGVYPFDDFDMLELTSDRFYENGIPIIMSIMPVYYNTDYPAFKRYANTLKYIQSRGTSLIMHEPIVRVNELIVDDIDVRLAHAYESYEENGVHVFEQTVFPYEVSLDMLTRIQPTNELFISLPIDTVVKFDVFKDESELDGALNAVNKKWMQIGDYGRNYTDNTYVYRETQIDESYVYREKDETRYTFLVDKGNQILSIIVLISSIVILGLIMLGYRLYRSKFLKRK